MLTYDVVGLITIAVIIALNIRYRTNIRHHAAYQCPQRRPTISYTICTYATAGIRHELTRDGQTYDVVGFWNVLYYYSDGTTRTSYMTCI